MPDLSAEEIKKREEQQKKFNDELVRTKLLTEAIFENEEDIAKELQKNIDRANQLNVKFGTGVDIAKELGKERIQNAVKIQSLENSIAVKQAQLSKTRKADQTEALAREIQSIKNQIKLTEAIDAQLYKIEQSLEEEKQLTKEKKKQNDIIEQTKNKYKEIAKSFTLAALLKQVLDFTLAADVQVTELGKSLGVSKTQSRAIRDNFASFARSSGDAFVTTKKLMEAQGELTQELGVAGTYSGKQTEDFSRLTKLMGLSVNEAGKLARLSVLNGTSIEATTKSVIKGSFAAQQTNKVSFDQRTILKEVANLSEGILIKFQGNSEALGAAVVQAKALGLNLEQVDKIGDSLLNFESSIENELKAELITGKQINLEKARAAALTGDQAALSAEIASQAGDLADYQKMNVIAQNSLAEAFGMGREEMSKMLMDQEKFKKLGDVSNKNLAEQLKLLKAQGEPMDSVLYKQIQQQAVQEKFNNAIEKLQDLIGSLVAGPLGSMLDIFASIADNAVVMYGIMGLISGLLLGKMAVGLAKTITQLGIALGISTAKAAADTASAEAVTLGGATIPILAGIGAVVGMIAAISSSGPKLAKGGIVTGEVNNATIGEAGPEAIIPLNSPKAAGMLGGGMDITPMVSAINEVRNAINALASKSGDVHLDGQKVGKTLGGVKALGTSQVQNSYQVA
jgi:hypothetical protein